MKHTTIGILTALAGAATIANADTVSIVHQGHAGDYGADVTIQLSGGLFFQDGGSTHSLWAGLLSNTIDGEAAKTYCTELTQWAGDGEFEVVSVDQAPNPGNGMGQTKADAIYRLFNATNRGGDIDTNAEAAAFQAVIWEIVYEYTGDESTLNIGTGNVRFTGGVNSTLFATFAGYAADTQGDTTPTVTAYINNTRQDQLGPTVIPLPGVAAMAGFGLGGIAIRRRRV